MGKFLVEGRRSLHGEIRINGAKNSALKLMSAALLGQGTFTLTNVPRISDVYTMIGVLEALGVSIQFISNQMRLDVTELQGRPPKDLTKSMRASVQVMGPLLAKLGWVEVAEPGGCAIGDRPLDIHLEGFKQMGVQIAVQGDVLTARAERLRGADITFRYPSVGATENIMMAATLAQGETIIRNAAREPEIIDIQEFLKSMGAKIEGAGTSVIKITGVSGLDAADFSVMPDRIEAGTYLLAFLITGGCGILENVIPEHLSSLLKQVRAMGAEVETKDRTLRVCSPKRLRPFQLFTHPYPGFPTDLQPQMAALATQAVGQSELIEAVFDQRFGYTAQLKKLGAQVELNKQSVLIKGPTSLQGNTIVASDLRAGAALVLASLSAEGQSIISGIEHIDRGYESIEERLSQLGAKIVRLLE